VVQFWGVGIRLLTAGASQSIRPEFTARSIFKIDDPDAAVIVNELGFANLAFGLIGTLSLLQPTFLTPAAIAGGLFLGLDGVLHLRSRDRSRNETVAMVTDLAVALAVLIYMIGLLT